MDRETLYQRHAGMCGTALDIMKRKNQDYATSEDPFSNFHEFGSFGILVRLSDKFARLKNCIQKGDVAVKDESITDTILDSINYLVLLHAYLYQNSTQQTLDDLFGVA